MLPPKPHARTPHLVWTPHPPSQFWGPLQPLLFFPDVLVPSSVGSIREALVRHWGDWLGRPSSYLGMGTAGWAMEVGRGLEGFL